jgi:multicomponent Na+:H+ antiporter subunit G
MMVVAEVVRYLAAVLVVVGSTFAFLAALGLFRLPDLYTRMHAASKAGVVGAGFTLLGLAFASLDAGIALRAILGITFLLLTTPVSAHLLARAAYLAGTTPDPATTTNELSTHNFKTPAGQ